MSVRCTGEEVAISTKAAASRAMAIPMCVRRAILPFLVSRLLILLIVIIVPIVAEVPKELWTRGEDDAVATLTKRSITAALKRAVTVNDAGWYLGVARDGYDARPFDASRQTNWAFFPLHPLLWRALGNATGSWIASGLLLANLFGFAALALLWQLARQLGGTERLADQAVMFAAFWPTAYFEALPHTEALFFALVSLSFLAAEGKRWALAAGAGFLAGATRFNGIFVFVGLVCEWAKGPRRIADLAKLLPSLLGIALFAAYLGWLTGNPLAFKDIQVAWGRQAAFPWVPIVDYLSQPAAVVAAWNPRFLNFLVAVLALLSAYTCYRRRWYGLAVFTLLTLTAGLCSGTLMSITRYVGVAPGVFVALAVWCEASPRLAPLLLATSAVSLALLCTAFAAGFTIGGA